MVYSDRMRIAVAAATLALLPSCSAWFFSGEQWIDRSRPAVLVETTGGVDYGAATEFGVLTLGRSAASGPCRVHYLLGPTPIVESGELLATGSIFTRADIDLKTQLVRVLDRSPTAADELRVMWLPDGHTVQSLAVELADHDGVRGDALADPGTPLPAGATVLCRNEEDGWLFVGLIAGRATLRGPHGEHSCYVFAGVDRLRELLATPTPHTVDMRPKYRTDDISVLKPAPRKPPPPEQPEVPVGAPSAEALQTFLRMLQGAPAAPTQPQQPPR